MAERKSPFPGGDENGLLGRGEILEVLGVWRLGWVWAVS